MNKGLIYLLIVSLILPGFLKPIKAQVIESEIGANDIAVEYEATNEIKDDYTLVNSALIKKTREDEGTIIVGDYTKTTFEPSVEITKWGGDAQFKLTPRLKSSTGLEKDVSFSGNKIIYKNNAEEEVHYYEKPSSVLTPDGAFEIEFVLNAPSLSNQVVFDIETTNLEFLYQPPLNEEQQPPEVKSCTATECMDGDGNVIVKRPENVVGSYAVYHSSKKNGAYKTGKVAHIYRPLITDALGKSTYGDLHIDTIAKTLTVTIPQSYLNTAIYPIKADPTLGYTIAGATGNGFNNDAITCATSTAPTNGQVMSINFYGSKGTTNLGARAAFYLATTTFIGTTTAETSINSATNKWWTLTVPVSSAALGNNNPRIDFIGGNEYYICIFHDYSGTPGDTVFIYYDSGQPENDAYNQTGLTYPNWPATTTFTTNLERKNSIYAVYSGKAMAAYTLHPTTTIRYRFWDDVNFTWDDIEIDALKSATTTNYIRLAYNPTTTKEEILMVTLDNSGNIMAQTWNGNVWATSTQLATSSATAVRSFDVAFEQTGRYGMVVYRNQSTADPEYRLWSSTSSQWLASSTIDSPLTGTPNWIELEFKPGVTSTDMGLAIFDSNSDTWGAAWSGTSTTWYDIANGTVWDNTASDQTGSQSIDLAYERQTGRLMVIWGDATSTDQYYRIYDGATITNPTLLDIAASGGTSEYVRLVGDYASTTSNLLCYGVSDTASDLNTRCWSGSAWDAAAQHPEHDAGIEDNNRHIFDLAFDASPTSSSRVWLAWGDGDTVSRRYWSPTSSVWSATTTSGDDTSIVNIEGSINTSTAEVFFSVQERGLAASRDIVAFTASSGQTTIGAPFTFWGGPTPLDAVGATNLVQITSKPVYTQPVMQAATSVPVVLVRRFFPGLIRR